MNERSTGYEVEVKCRVDNHEAVRRALAAEGALGEGIFDLEDVYLAHPARDFAQTGEAFRVRRIGDDNRITYKGPKRAGPIKTREETEIRFEPGRERFEDMVAVYVRLGFAEVARVRKRREPMRVMEGERTCEVVLDEVEGLGRFVEVETLAKNAAEIDDAEAAVNSLRMRLGLNDIEPRSYLRMVLEAALSSSGKN